MSLPEFDLLPLLFCAAGGVYCRVRNCSRSRAALEHDKDLENPNRLIAPVEAQILSSSVDVGIRTS